MSLNIEKLEKQHPVFLYAQDVKEICRPLETLNITSFAHAKTSSDNNNVFSVVTNNPGYFKLWIQKEHYKADITVDPKCSDFENYILWDYAGTKGQTREMLEDANYSQHNHCFTIIKKIDSTVNAYTFATSQYNESINQQYISNIDLLENFIDYFNLEIDKSRDIKTAYQIQFENIGGAKNHESLLGLEKIKREAFYNQIAKGFPHFNFTDRELDCIPMLLSGRTMNEMAVGLNISPRTVENHLASLKNKMNARNKEALIIKLMKLNPHQFRV